MVYVKTCAIVQCTLAQALLLDCCRKLLEIVSLSITILEDVIFSLNPLSLHLIII